MEGLKVQKFGSSYGKHASCTFYKAFKLTKNGKSRVITLGQFFFMKILKGIPVCIGELQLVWEDKTSSQDLASVRLYFLPECTPEGRQTHHGEDEVLAYSEKIVLKLDDLATLVVEDVSWSDGRRAHTTEKLDCHEEQTDYAEAFGMNSFGLDNREMEQEAKETEETVIPDTSPNITVMSYSRYCRYRSIIKRLENCADKWMRHAVTSALGGFHSANENNRIYFCRDLFDHADLDDFELRCDHLAPSLKGRPRKRRGSKQGTNGNDSSEDSSCSSSFSSQQENTANKIRTGARATPLRNGFRIDKVRVSDDEQDFLIELHKFMKSRNTPIGRIPSLGFKQIDLFQFYSLAEDIGGYEQICEKRSWKNIYDALGGNPGSTSAATYTRRHYEKLLLPYERYRRAMYPSRRRRPRVVDHSIQQKMEDASKAVVKKEEVKENIKNEEEEEPRLNGHSVVPGHMKKEVPLCNLANRNADITDKAAILKQEMEKMKMRKDAQNPPEKEKITNKEKMWEERRKNKLGEKVRKPGAGCQKTVRELLDQNGRELSELNIEKSTDIIKQEHLENRRESKSEQEKSDLSVSDKKVPQNLSGSVNLGEPRNSKPALLSPLGQPHPLFYPQLLPMAGGIRGMAQMPLPFMIPHVGMPSVSNPLQVIHSSGNPTYKDSHTKSLHAFSKSVTEHKEPKIHASSDLKRAIPDTKNTNPRESNIPMLSTPPTAHSQPPKPLSSPATHTPQRPITPAHTNQLKRNYPYNDMNKTHTPFSTSQIMDASKSLSDPSHKRSKHAHSAGSNVFSSQSSQLDIPVLDLSMKTLRAKEARQQRGESLLFNTTFSSKDIKSSSKTLPYEAPQDLSVKPSSKSLAFDLSSSSSLTHSQKGTPLNIPHFRSPTEQKNMSFSIPVMSESHRSDSKHSSLKPELQLSTSKMPPIGLAPIQTIGGLPIDMGALVHPAFPQQLLMQGVFPTPLQLQQMIQGQVAASMLHPDYIQQSLMFPPTLTSLPSSFAPSSSSTSAKPTSTSSSSSKR